MQFLTLAIAFQEIFKKNLCVKLQSPTRFLLHAISQYWNNYGLMQYVFGYLCLNEA